MAVNKEQIEHLALLARLDVTENEKKKYAEQISAILDYIEQLRAIDTAGIEPLAQVFELENVVRADEPRIIFSQGKVMAAAPETEAKQIKVKTVLEKEWLWSWAS